MAPRCHAEEDPELTRRRRRARRSCWSTRCCGRWPRRRQATRTPRWSGCRARSCAACWSRRARKAPVREDGQVPGGEGFCKSGAQSRGEWAAFQARLQHGVMGVAWHGIVTYIFHGKRLPGQAGESGQPRWCLFHGQPMRQPVRRPVPRCADAWSQPGAEDTPTGLLAPPLPRGGGGTQRGRARRLLTQRMATAHTAGTRHTRSHAGDGPGSRPSAAPIPSPYIRPRAGQGGERGGRGRGPGRGHRGAVPAAARRAGGRPRPPAALAAAAARRRSARSRPAWIPDIGSGFLSWDRAWRSIARRIACTPCHTMP